MTTAEFLVRWLSPVLLVGVVLLAGTWGVECWCRDCRDVNRPE